MITDKQVEAARIDLCERICAAIKAADDKSSVEADYMLDSNDCIRIVREQFAAEAAREPADYPNPGAHTPLRPAVLDDERAQYEAVARNLGLETTRGPINSEAEWEYLKPRTQFGWEVWQAALSQSAPAAQGEAQNLFGWAVLDKKGCTERVLSRVHYEFAHIEPVIRSEPDPKELLAYLDREYKGAAPHRIVPLYTTPQPSAPGVVSDALAFPAGLHPRTADLVRRFSVAMAEKLFAAQEKYGYSDGWANDDWLDDCRAHLLQHIAKGDPRDVANYAAFLWHHGASTAAAQPSADDAPPVDENGAVHTGDAAADRIINRLNSSDPDFDDCAAAAAWIYRAASDRPDGFTSWKDAAIHERARRVDLERAAPPADARDAELLAEACGRKG